MVDTESDRLSKDLIFGLLSNQRRRWVLKYMAETAPETTLNALAEHLAAWEHDKEVGQTTSSERKRVYVGLYQTHLPKMNDANVIEYNQAEGTVKLRPEADQLLIHLTVNRPNRTEPWRHRLIPAPLLDRWEKHDE